MGRGIRVKFEPARGGETGGIVSVPGATLTLVEFGGNTTAAERETPKAAKLLFHGAYLDHARKVSSPEFSKFASLAGQVKRRGVPPRAVFILGEDAKLEHDEPEPENGEPFRELKLAFDPACFDEVPEDGGPATRLRLPLEPDDARFFELAIELELDGSKEAPLEKEHRLDVPLPPRPGPIFEWSEELTAHLPIGLTLILEEGGKRQALDWQQGEVTGDFRRFAFSKIKGTEPCTLVAQAGQKKLILLDQQVIAEPGEPISWTHLLEDFTVEKDDPDDDDIVRFAGAMNVPAGTV